MSSYTEFFTVPIYFLPALFPVSSNEPVSCQVLAQLPPDARWAIYTPANQSMNEFSSAISDRLLIKRVQ